MKTACIVLMMITFVFVVSTSATAEKAGIRPSDVAGEPTAFCKVLKEPDAILLGGWKGVHTNFWKGKSAHDPVQFFLKKYGDQYAIYFYRSKEHGGGKDMRGWRNFTINGNLMDSGTGIRLFAENGEVFFSYERGAKEKPTKLTLIPGSESW